MNENLKSIYDSFANECVQYECTCKLKKPITLTYFCRYCLELRCRNCVSNEVDSQYCQHCLEYIPTMDGKLKKNKCASCFQCPSCMHTLSTRSFLEQVPSEENPQQMTTKRTFTLVCCFCKWTSLDVGIPKQYGGFGNWPENVTPNAKTINSLFEHYRVVAQKEKLEKDKKRSKRPLNAFDLFDKYGISVSLSPRVNDTLLRSKVINRLNQTTLNSTKEIETKPAEASDYVEPLDEEFYYKEDINITDMSSSEQRLNQIETQPEVVDRFFPISKMLSVKRSLRCKVCEHNLIKSEYNPCLIRLKIQLSAYYHLPEIKIKDVSNLKMYEPSRIELTMKNPSSNSMKVKLSQNLNKDMTVNADIELPDCELVLLPKDETLEIGINQTEQQDAGDDPNIISFRKANKIGFYVTVRPENSHKDCIISFTIKHDFESNINEKNGKKELELSPISNNVYLNLGKVV